MFCYSNTPKFVSSISGNGSFSQGNGKALKLGYNFTRPDELLQKAIPMLKNRVIHTIV